MSFQSLGLLPPLLRAVTELNYTTPSPVQAQAIPIALKGLDILASAQTGTGKTAGYVLPILQHLSKQPLAKSHTVSALILTPTRELACQVYEEVKKLGRYLPLRATPVYGGAKMFLQKKKLSQGVDILIATPGRLLDLHKQRAMTLAQVKWVVLDEADRMLDMGFIPDVKQILSFTSSQRQTLFFSATFSNKVCALAKTILKAPKEIHLAPQNQTALLVKQQVHPVDKARKAALLQHLIQHHQWMQVLVFSRTKVGANKLMQYLKANHLKSGVIHGDKTQAQRTRALKDFKTGKVQVLVATDVAARGLDIHQLPCVVNFDLPHAPEDYVHRIGRTGRAGAEGLALSLVSADEAKQLFSIENLIRKQVERVEVDEFEPKHALPTDLKPKARPKKASGKPGSNRRWSKGRGKKRSR